jgi:DNA-binding response OmpR family regulator
MVKPIFVVEDNAKDLELALVALEPCHLATEMHVVRDGEQALHYLFREGRYQNRPADNPAVVLLDVKLPMVDGHEVFRRVRASAALKTIPVAMLTTSHEEVDVVHSYDLRANTYVVKPVEFKDLVAAIEQLGTFWAVVNEPPPGSVRHDPTQRAVPIQK